VAFKKAKGMVGKTITVLVDRPAGRDAEDGWVARGTGQAPDIDSVTLVHGEELHPGQLIEVKVTGAQGYDLVAEVPKKRGRSLKVLAQR
jgi:tRNA A37 methylthiotransferase MiaB